MRLLGALCASLAHTSPALEWVILIVAGSVLLELFKLALAEQHRQAALSAESERIRLPLVLNRLRCVFYVILERIGLG